MKTETGRFELLTLSGWKGYAQELGVKGLGYYVTINLRVKKALGPMTIVMLATLPKGNW
jgi:hypothetical protein